VSQTCGKNFFSRSTLYSHARIVHRVWRNKLVVSAGRRSWVSNLNALKLHVKYAHVIKLESLKDKKRHLRKPTINRSKKVILVLKCPYCPCNYKNLSKMKSHIIQCHPKQYEAEAPEFCNICFKCLKSPSESRNHMKSHIFKVSSLWKSIYIPPESAVSHAHWR